MPFTESLRIRLRELKLEFESGLLPQVIYEELCRKTIEEYGPDAFELAPSSAGGGNDLNGSMFSSYNGDYDSNRRPRKHHKKRINDPNNKICCPAGCGKELLNTQGLATHLLAIHRQSIDDYILDPSGSKGTLYIPKPADWRAPTPEEISAQKAASFAAKKAAAMAAAGASGDISSDERDKGNISKKRKSESKSSPSQLPKQFTESSSSSSSSAAAMAMAMAGGFGSTSGILGDNGDGDDEDSSSSDDDETSDLLGLTEGGSRMFDKRKFNRGRAHRRSYSKDIKLQCIALREEGKSSEEVSRIMKISKSNIEKWCGEKHRNRILQAARTQVMIHAKSALGMPSGVSFSSMGGGGGVRPGLPMSGMMAPGGRSLDPSTAPMPQIINSVASLSAPALLRETQAINATFAMQQSNQQIMRGGPGPLYMPGLDQGPPRMDHMLMMDNSYGLNNNRGVATSSGHINSNIGMINSSSAASSSNKRGSVTGVATGVTTAGASATKKKVSPSSSAPAGPAGVAALPGASSIAGGARPLQGGAVRLLPTASSTLTSTSRPAIVEPEIIGSSSSSGGANAARASAAVVSSSAGTVAAGGALRKQSPDDDDEAAKAELEALSTAKTRTRAPAAPPGSSIGGLAAAAGVLSDATAAAVAAISANKDHKDVEMESAPGGGGKDGGGESRGDSDSDDEDDVMELLGELRTKKANSLSKTSTSGGRNK